MSATLIKPDGTVEEIAPENGKKFQLEELYKLVDCETIEVIHIPRERRLAIVDEDGVINLKERNPKATSVLATALGAATVMLRGNVIFCDRKQFT